MGSYSNRSTGGGLSTDSNPVDSCVNDNVLIVAAGNRDVDKGVVYRMSFIGKQICPRNESGL